MPVAVPKNNYYEVLNLSKDATEEEIRAAYKKLALKWHPDRHQDDKDDAQQKFIQINEAYLALLEHFQRQRRHQEKETTHSTAGSAYAPSSAASESGSSTHSSSTESHSKVARSKDSRTEERSHKSSQSSSYSKAAPVKTSSSHSHSTHRDRDKHETFSRMKSHIRSDSSDDSSSDDEEEIDLKKHLGSKLAGKVEESDYEFVDLGSPLHPLQSPKSKPTSSSSSKDKDWIFPLPLSLEDLYRGTSHHYRITRTLRSGKSQSVKIDIKVSSGWRKGTKIRVPGIGNERKDGTFQDIVFVVEEERHSRFTRVNDDLVVSVQVPWVDSRSSRPYAGSVDSVLDEKMDIDEDVYVKALNGEEYALPIPRSLVEAADGTRIVGAGMPIREHGKTVGKGDLIVKWDFVFPDSDKAQRSRLHTLRKAMNWKT